MAEGGKAQEVGVAYVSVVPSTKGFTGELRRQLAPEVQAAGASSSQSFASGFGANLGALKAVAATAGAAVAVSFAQQSLAAFAEADKAQKALQVTLTKFPGLADTNIEKLNALNQEMERKAAIDGDSLAAADAVLARFGLTGREIERLTPLLVDYATATGKDAASAASSLGKALLGNTRTLKEVGVDFTATGDRARDLETIMAALEARVGGQGAAFEASAAGQLKAFDLAIENLQETIGEQLVPSLELSVDMIQAVSGVVPDSLQGLNDLRTAFGVLASEIPNLEGPLGNVLRLLNQIRDTVPSGPSWSILDAIPGGAGGLLAQLGGAANPFAETDAQLQELGVTVDRTTGKVTATGAALRYLQSLPAGTAVSIDALRAAVEAADPAVGGLASSVDGSASSFTNAYAPAAAYVAMIERLGNFTLSDDAKRALDATMPSDEENRGRALDAAVAGRASRGDGTLTDAERNYWTDRARAAEVARKAAAEAAKKAADERARLAREAVQAAQAEAEARRRETEAFVKSVQDSITRYGAITGFQARGLLAPTAEQVTADMRARVAKARAFFPLVKRLSNLGLNKASLLEIIQAGPVAGTEIANALLAGGATSIKEVNALESQLQAAGTALGGFGASLQFGGQAPQVSVAVYIGNEQLDGRIDTRIAANGRTQQQTANRGSRT